MELCIFIIVNYIFVAAFQAADGIIQIHNGIDIIWRCHTLYMLQSFGLVLYA